MIYLLLIIGALLVALTARAVIQEWRNGITAPLSYLPTGDTGTSSACFEYLQSIEDKLEILTDSINGLNEGWAAGRQQWAAQGNDFARVLQETQWDKALQPEEEIPQTVNERIYRAYRQGMGITELAQEFGKGKGEIELILNLRR